LMAIVTARFACHSNLLRGAVSGSITAAVISLPFIVSGRLEQLLSLPGAISSVMPVVSADAHNFWWLFLQARGQDPIFMLDTARAFGPLTYRTAAGVIVAVV